MNKIRSLNELLSDVKRAVSGAAQKPNLYDVKGNLDIVVVVKGGYARFYDIVRFKTCAILYMDWYSGHPSIWDYAKLNAEKRREFIDYLAYKSFEECRTANGFYWIQEVGADEDAATMYNQGKPMDKSYTSQPFYLL